MAERKRASKNQGRLTLWGNLRVLGALLFLAFLSLPAFAEGVVSLRMRQAHVELPRIQVYLDLLDVSGRPVIPQSPDVFTASLGDKPLFVRSAEPWDAREEGVASVLLVDISRSFDGADFNRLRRSLSLWIREMAPKDRAALIVFGDKVRIAQDFTGQKETLLYALQQLKPSAQHSQLHQGILDGLDLARRRDPGLPRRRVLIVLSDGADDMPGGATAREVQDSIARDPVPIYAIGTLPAKGEADDEKQQQALKRLGDYARSSGGEMTLAQGASWESLMREVRASLARSLCVDCEAPGIPGDGTVRRLQMTYADGRVSLNDALKIRIPAPAVKVEPTKPPLPVPSPRSAWKRIPTWGYGAGGLGLLLLVIGVTLMVKRRRRRSHEGQDSDPGPSAPGPTKSGPAFEASAPRSSSGGGVPATVASGDGGATRRIEEGSTVRLAGASAAGDLQGVELALVLAGGRGVEQSLVARFSERLILGRTQVPGGLAIPGDSTISSRHCEILLQDGRLFLKDLGSTNGTAVNGVPVQGLYPLNEGDRIRMGKTEARLRISFGPLGRP